MLLTVFLLSNEKSGAVYTSHHDISRGTQGLVVPRVPFSEKIGKRDGVINTSRTVLGFGPHAFLRWPHLSNVLKKKAERHETTNLQEEKTYACNSGMI